jgi:hypothetical protein
MPLSFPSTHLLSLLSLRKDGLIKIRIKPNAAKASTSNFEGSNAEKLSNFIYDLRGYILAAR